MKGIAVITDPGRCTYPLEVNKILKCLKRNHAPPFEVTLFTLFCFFFTRANKECILRKSKRRQRNLAVINLIKSSIITLYNEKMLT